MGGYGRALAEEPGRFVNCLVKLPQCPALRSAKYLRLYDRLSALLPFPVA